MSCDMWKTTDSADDRMAAEERAEEREAESARERDLSVMFSRKSDRWATPIDLFVRLVAEFGGFGLDAAADQENALAERWLGPGSPDGDDALAAESWAALADNRAIWLNPPYSQCGPFMARAAAEAATGATVVVLVPARTDTRWWHAHVWDSEHHRPRPGVEVRLLRGRLKFGGATAGAPFPSAIVVLRGR